MSMKRIAHMIFLVSVSSTLSIRSFAQASGGAIRRPVKKPVPSSSVTSQRSSANSQTSTPTGRSRTAILEQLERDMVYVEGGTFMMGATSEQSNACYGNEEPAHEVTLFSFRICKHEVTQAEWEAVMSSNFSDFKGANRPVENVSWYDCQTFIKKLIKLTGKSYRLPTEAEWEYAARGGQKSMGYRYSGSNTLGNVAWYNGNSGDETHDVMTKLPNELGLYDMSGNVLEWCQDRYSEDYYASSPRTNPKGPSSGSSRVVRGGDWAYGSGETISRVSSRSGATSTVKSSWLGFRLAL